MTVDRSLRVLMLLILMGAAFSSSACADIGSPLRVKLAMPELPAVGQEGTIECGLQSADTLKGVNVTVSLPDGVELVDGELCWQADLPAQVETVFRLKVRITSEGNKNIRAVAFCRLSDSEAYSDVGELFFHSGQSYAIEGYLLDVVAAETPTVSEQSGQVVEPTKLADYIPSYAAPVTPQPDTGEEEGAAITTLGVQPQATITIRGKWTYRDRSDMEQPLKYVAVQLLRGDDETVLAQAYTGGVDGSYAFSGVTNPGEAGFKVRAWTYYYNSNSVDGKALRVVPYGQGRSDDGNTLLGYTASTPVAVSDSTSYNFGTVTIPKQDNDNIGAWWLIEDLVNAWYWCYARNNHNSRAGGVTVEWSPNITLPEGDHNHRTDDGGNIHMSAASCIVPDVVLHEYGHEVMWDGYGQWLPSSDCPSPHYINKASAPACAWSEGFATAFKMAVTNDPVFRYPGGGFVNLEAPTWNSPAWDNGDRVEGRVACALWDVFDAAQDGYDTSSVTWDVVWQVWWGSTRRDSTFADFWVRWKSLGKPKHNTVKAFYQNTINYNTPPTFAGLPDKTLEENKWLENAIDLYQFASDPESSDSELEYTITDNTDPRCGVSIDVTNRVDIYPYVYWTGESTVTISCSDGIDTVTDSFVVTVTPINQAPIISGIPNQTLNEDTPRYNAIDLRAYAYDPETPDSDLIYTIISYTNSDKISVTINENDFIDIVPSHNWSGTSTVTVRCTDPEGLYGETTFTITVRPVNDPPAWNPALHDVTILPGVFNDNVIDLATFAEDPESPDSFLTFSIVSMTDPKCGATIDAGNFIDFDPDPDWSGISEVTVRVQDPEGLWADGKFLVTSSLSTGRIADARGVGDEGIAVVRDKIVTAVFDGYFYIEEPDRTAGIRVLNPNLPMPTVNAKVSVTGYMGATAGRERYMMATGIDDSGATTPVRPLAIPGGMLGGKAPNEHTASVPSSSTSLYNIGLLVRVTGRVVRHDEADFYIDDGSRMIDSWPDHAALWIDGDALGGWLPPMGSVIAVTGISSSYDNAPVRLLRPRSRADVQVYYPTPNRPPAISGIPDKLVAQNSMNDNVLDPSLYASDPETPASQLTYSISAVTEPQCGVSIGPDGLIDINPEAGWTGCSDVTVRAQDPDRLWAEDTFRVIVALDQDRIWMARDSGDGTWVALRGKVTTARFADCIYIEETDRTAGIKVATTNGPAPGRTVIVAGIMATVNAERQINAYYLEDTGPAELGKLIGMTDGLMGVVPRSMLPGEGDRGARLPVR